MKIVCQKCSHAFFWKDPAPRSIRYRQCRQVFSLELEQTVCCPQCRENILANTDGKTATTVRRPLQRRKRELKWLDHNSSATPPSPMMPEQQPSKKITAEFAEEHPEIALPDSQVTESFTGRGFLGVFLLSFIVAAGLYRVLAPQETEVHQTKTEYVHDASFYPSERSVLSPTLQELESLEKSSWFDFVAEHLEAGSQSSNFLPTNAYLSSGFGYRIDPFSNDWRFHHGLDIAMRHGSEIKALLPGRIRFAGHKGHYGRVVFIEHPHGLQTVYGHLSRVLVDEGDLIEQHQVIGLAGMTGRATGPHLHFELRLHDKKIDPTMLSQFEFLTKKRSKRRRR